MAKNTAEKNQVYLFFGEDSFLVDKEASGIIEKLKPSLDPAFGMERIDGAVNTVAEACDAVSKTVEALVTRGFCGGKLVWLKNASFLDRSVTGRSKAVKDKLEALSSLVSSGLPSGHVLLVSSLNVDKTTSFYKTLKKTGDVREFAPEKAPYRQVEALKQFVASECKNYGLTISDRVMSALQERAGTSKTLLCQEIAKLSLFLGERKEVTSKDVQLVVSPSREASNFDFLDAVGKKDIRKALTLLRDMLFHKDNSIGVIFMMESHFKQLGIFKELIAMGLIERRGRNASVKSMPGELEQTLEKLLKRKPQTYHSFYLGKMVEQSDNFSAAKIRAVQKIIAQTHQKMVRSSIPKEILLELALIRVCR